MKFLLILLFACIFIVLCRNGIIEGMENEDTEDTEDTEENDSCDNNGVANSDFNNGMQYALDKKVAKEENDDYEHTIVHAPRSCFTKGYNAIYHNIETSKLFE